MISFTRYLEDLAMATGYMSEIKLIEGLTTAAETLGGEIIFFSLSGNVYLVFTLFHVTHIEFLVPMTIT